MRSNLATPFIQCGINVHKSLELVLWKGKVEIGERFPINKEGMDSVVRATTNLERWSVRVYIQTSDQWESPIVPTSALI